MFKKSAAPSTGYNLTKSLRFRSSASAYLSRTPASAGNRKTWTWSAWIKRGTLGVEQSLFACGTSASDTAFGQIIFGADNTFLFNAYTLTWRGTSAVYRDPSAWYHFVVAFDTTQAVASNRVKLYVNGLQITSFQYSNDPSLNTDYAINQAIQTTIGRYDLGGGGNYFDGYIAEQNFIDGQALTPSSFGSTNALTGVWQPAKYTGTYGTNGFYLPFTNTTSTSTLGNDFSGNSNTWTVNNISLTTGSTYDSMTDVPTLTSATTANYATWNPLKATAGTYSSANLGVVRSGAANVDLPVSTMQIPKTTPIYCEFSFGNQDSSYGIASATSTSGANGIVGSSADGATYGAYITTSSSYYGFWNNNSRTSYDFSGGTVYQMAFDQASGKLWFGKDGTWYNSGNPASGTNPTFSSVSTTTDFFVAALANTSACSANFGQQPFTYTPPTGFVALNTYNLPTSTIVKGNTVMDATTYTGTGSAASITNTASFKPDLVWLKSRSNVTNHYWTDSVRGTSQQIYSNSTAAEGTSGNIVTALNSNGFSLGTDAEINGSTRTYVGWQWQAGQGNNVSNTSGSITSTVSVNASAGFSIATFTTASSGTSSVGHGLGVTPSFVIFKTRSTTSNWICQHTSTGTQYLLLNGTSAATTDSTVWNSAPTSTVVNMGTGFSGYGGATAVMYSWAEVAGFSKFGSYTGNGSSDGPFVYTGFRPKFVMFKKTSDIGGWWMIDTSRSTYNQMADILLAESSGAEFSTGTGWPGIDYLSNGFKIRATAGGINTSSGTYIYAAFAENPTKFALAR